MGRFSVLEGIIYPFARRDSLWVQGFIEDFFLLYQSENQQKLYTRLYFEIPSS